MPEAAHDRQRGGELMPACDLCQRHDHVEAPPVLLTANRNWVGHMRQIYNPESEAAIVRMDRVGGNGLWVQMVDPKQFVRFGPPDDDFWMTAVPGSEIVVRRCYSSVGFSFTTRDERFSIGMDGIWHPMDPLLVGKEPGRGILDAEVR